MGCCRNIPVFGLLKRGGRVCTQIIPNASGATLIPIIKRKVIPDSIVYSGGWKAYNVLDISDFKHFRKITQNSSQALIITSAEPRVFGAKKSATCANSKVSRRLNSACI